LVSAKEALILIGREAGANLRMLSEMTGISGSAISRRYDAAKSKMRENGEMSKLVEKIEHEYWRGSN
jgi:hypothetical protein